MPFDGERIVRRYNQGLSIRSPVDERRRVLAPYIDPSRFNVNSAITQPIEGQPWMTEVYDSQAIYANDVGAMYINGHATNPATKWFGLKERRSELNQEDEVREWLEESRNRMLGAIALSNGYAEFHEVYKDWWGFGDSCCKLEERPFLDERPIPGFRGPRFTVTRVGQYVVELDGWYEPNGVMQEFMITAEAAVERFKLDRVSEKIREAYHNDRHEEKFRIIHAVLPRRADEYGAKANQKMPFASLYVEYDAKNVLQEGGYKKFPAFIPRQLTVYGETYGRGRGDIAMNDILSLSTLKRMSFEDLGLKTRPPTFYDGEHVFGELALRPGVFHSVRRNGQRPIADLFYQYQTGSHPEVTALKEEELRKSIREVFFIDHIRELMMINATSKDITAFQYARTEMLVQKMIAPIYSRLNYQFHIPLIERLFDMMMEQGALSPPPDILLEQGGQIDVEFDSPLSRAQKADEIGAMERYMEMVMPLAEAQAKFSGKQYAEILDNIPFDQWAAGLAQDLGVPASRMRSPKEVAVIRGSRAEEEQAQQINAEMAGGAEALGKAAPFLKAIQGGQAAA